MRERARPSIQDVATEAGVSRAAVSKVIRGAYGVSPAMNERVTAAIAKLGYRPSTVARSLRGAGRTVGLEVPFLGNPYVTDVVGGACRAARGTPYQVIVAPAEVGPDEGRVAITALADRGVDAVVTVSPLVPPGWLAELAATLPVVMVGRHDRSDAYDTVTGDDDAGARAVMAHLLGLGHRRVAHLTRTEEVTVPGSPHAVRLAAYLDALAAAPGAAPPAVVRCGIAESDAHAAALDLLAGPDRPTAVFAGNDELALGVQRAAADLGLGPDELSVAGYDDVMPARHPGVSLTTVAQSGAAMGATAMRLVLERIGGRTGARHETLPVELRVRSSTRAAPAA